MDNFILIAHGRLFLLLIFSFLTIFLFGQKTKNLKLIMFLILGLLIIIRPFEFWEDRDRYESLLNGGVKETLFKGHLLYLFLFIFPTFKLKIYFTNFLFSYSLFRLYKIITKNFKSNLKELRLISIYFICTLFTLFPTILFFHPRQAFSVALYLLSFSSNIFKKKSTSLNYGNIISISLKLISILMHPINFLSFIIELFFSKFYFIKRFNFKQLGFKKFQSIFFPLILLVTFFGLITPLIINNINSIYVFFANLIPGFSAYATWSLGDANTSDPIIKLIVIITLLIFPLSLKSNSQNNNFTDKSNYSILLYSSLFIITIELAQSYLQLYSFDRLISGIYPIFVYALFKEIMLTKNIKINLYSYLGIIITCLLSLIRIFNLTNAYSYYLN